MFYWLILYINGGTLSTESTLNARFFEKLFMAIYLFTLREDIAEEITFVFSFDVWPGARTLVLRLSPR